MELVAQPTFKGNGMAYDVDGSLLVCEQVSSCRDPDPADGRRELVAWHYEGVYLNSPNDVVVASPRRQHLLHRPRLRALERLDRLQARVRAATSRACTACRRAAATSSSSSPPDEFEQPNGLCFSPDESLLYVNDSPRARDQGLRRRRRRHRSATGACSATSIGHGHDGRGQPRRHGVRRARQHLDVGPGRRVGARPPTASGSAPIETPEICGSVVFGRPRPAHAVPDDDHDCAHDADARALRARAGQPLSARKRPRCCRQLPPRSSRFTSTTRAARLSGGVSRRPSYFLKPPSSLAGDGDPIVRPQGTELLTFEGEVALVIGKTARGVSPDQALAHIGWYAPANDVGLHDMRWSDRGSNVLSKGHDGFTPVARACPPPTSTRPRSPSAHARQRRGRAGRLHREPALPVRAARGRPLALHDARARRHHPHRHAGGLAPGGSGRRRRGRARRPLVAQQPDRRGRCPDRLVRCAAACLARRRERPRSASTRRGP